MSVKDLDILVVQLLHVILGILLDILWQSVLDVLLESLDNITADIAHSNLRIFCLRLCLLCELTAAFLSHWWKADADYLAIVLRCDAERRVDDCLLNHLEHTFFPRSDDDALCIRARAVGNLCEIHW